MKHLNHIQNNEINTKSKIFQTAAHLFAEKGFNGVSMREISEQSGVSKPTIYYYFGSKEGIYKELVNTGVSHIYAAVENIREMEVPIKNKLSLLLKQFFQLSRSFPDFANFFLTLIYLGDRFSFLNKWKAEADRRSSILADMIRQGIESGEFGAGANPELAAAVYWGVCVHFILQQINSKEEILSEKLADDIIDMLFRGLNE